MIFREHVSGQALKKLSAALPWFDSWLPLAFAKGFKVSSLICPAAGTGAHRWLFISALRLRRFGLDDDQITEFLQVSTQDCGRVISDHEISDAVRNSRAERLAHTSHPPRTRQASPFRAGPAASRWPARDYRLIQHISLNGPSVEQLSAASPWIPEALEQVRVLDLLFPGDPLLCCGWKFNRGNTLPKSWWLDHLDDVQFIVPSPMSKNRGKTQDGRPSYRTINNTGPRRYLVVEFDFKEHDIQGHDTPDVATIRVLRAAGRDVKDLCASLAAHLATLAPLVQVVDSGGKSLHAWFNAQGVNSDLLMRFMRYAVSIGADPMTYTPCQFVRLPGGLRDNGKVQQVIYFDPSKLP